MELFRLLGTIAVENSAANKAIDETTTKAHGSGEKIGNSFARIGEKSIELGNKMKWVSAGAATLLGTMVKSAADVKAMNAQFEQTFAEVEDKASAAMQRVADSSGIIETRLKGVGTKLYAFAKTTGMDTPQALDMMERSLTVAADSAAYYDRSLDETTESLQSFLKGNFENDAALGLSCTETTRNAAANKLFGKSYMELSEAQKQLTLLQMVEDANKLSGAMGQAARESDGWENIVGNLQEALKQLAAAVGENILPAVTKFAQKATGMIQKFADMSDGQKKFISTLLLIAAAASPVLTIFGKFMTTTGKIISTTSKLNTVFLSSVAAVKNYTTATKGASLAAGVANGKLTKQQAIVGGLGTKFMNLIGTMNPMVLGIVGAGAALGGLALAFHKVYTDTHQATIAANEFSDSNDKNIESIKSNSKESEFYAQKLDELSQKENKSSQDKQLMQAYVDKLNQSVEGLGLSYDAESDKLNQTTEDIYKKIDAMKQEALQSAYIEQSKKALDKYASSQIKLTKAQDDLKASQKEWNSLSDSEKQTRGDLAKKIQEQKRSVDDLKSSTAAYWTEYLRQSNQAAMASGQWDKLVNEAKAAGIKVPQSLTQGIKDGKYAIPTSVSELEALIKFDNAVQKAGSQGKATADKLAAQIASGKITVEEATKQLTDATANQMGKAPADAKTKGKNTGEGYAKGTSGAKKKAESAGKDLGNAAKAGAGSISLYNTGYNIGSGLASGMRNATKIVQKAANALASAADAAIKKAQEIKSPSRKQRRNGRFTGKGYALGLLDMVSMVRDASDKLAEAATPAVKPVDISTFGSTAEMMKASSMTAATMQPMPVSTAASVPATNNNPEIMVRILDRLQQIQETLQNRTIEWNDRELGRFVKNYAR